MATHINIYLWAFGVFFLWPSLTLANANTINIKSAAVILTYHRVGESIYPDTNINIEQFNAHINELENGGYTILPLPEIIKALKNNKTLPDKTIAITFEGAYKSALTNAFPVLIKKQIPFTLFFASNNADNNSKQHMNWTELRRLNRYKFITLGMHPATYSRLAGKPDNQILNQINKARLRFRKTFKREPSLFSYPFGEYSKAYSKLIKKQNFDAALSLNSGTASAFSDMFALPSFTMTENYSDSERFTLITNARPFPVYSIEPQDPYLTTNSPSIGFSVAKEITKDLKKLSCFVSGQKQPEIEILGENRVELRLNEPLTTKRTRINCTLPLPHKKNKTPHWRWFGMLLINNN